MGYIVNMIWYLDYGNLIKFLNGKPVYCSLSQLGHLLLGPGQEAQLRLEPIDYALPPETRLGASLSYTCLMEQSQ